jgi:hypothetical protein
MSFVLNDDPQYPTPHPRLQQSDSSMEIVVTIVAGGFIEFTWNNGEPVMGLDADEARQMAEQTLKLVKELAETNP